MGSLGMLTIGVGLYFMLARPAMLPEDLRYTGVAAGQLHPAMALWLRIVFRTWGGFMTGFGLALLGIGGYLVTTRMGFLYSGTAAAVLVSFGIFAAGNFEIRSRSLPFICILLALAFAASVAIIREMRAP